MDLDTTPSIDRPPAAAAVAVPPAPACRERTLASRRRSVEGAIAAMHERLGEPLSLGALARAAASSPYHFDRIFRQVTGVPPFRFLAALRLDEARRLLLTTRYSATAICFEVGYNSVGSFTRQFSEAVGMPPHRLRCFAAAGAAAASLARADEVDAVPPAPDRAGVTGRVEAPEGFEGVVFVGLFATPLPSGRPAACVLLHGPGPFRIAAVADGVYHLFAAGVPAQAAAAGAGALLHDQVLRGAAAAPLAVRGGRAEGSAEVVLRPRDPVDPPILVSLPVLLTERLSAPGDGAAASALASHLH